MLNKLERKFGRYAINNLMLYIVIGYVIGYGFALSGSGVLSHLTLEPCFIIRGELWRLFTWVIIPPSTTNILFMGLMLFMYYQLGTALERTWGAFRFNLYILGGLFFTVIAAFIDFAILIFAYGYNNLQTKGLGNYVTTYYILLSIFLAFAIYFPDMEVRLYFIIPIKMKWMSVIYVVLILLSIISSPWYVRIIIIASVLNFLIFFLSTRNYRRISPKEIKRRSDFKKAVKDAEGQKKATVMYDKKGVVIARHRCAICGRTEADDEKLEFRFCSKCVGNFEYCSEHLFTHVHKE